MAMRDHLSKLRGFTFNCTMVYYGPSPYYSWNGDSPLLFKNIILSHPQMQDTTHIDHQWFGKQDYDFTPLNLQPSDVVVFKGRVGQYMKGYKGNSKEKAKFYNRPEADYRINIVVDEPVFIQKDIVKMLRRELYG